MKYKVDQDVKLKKEFIFKKESYGKIKKLYLEGCVIQFSYFVSYIPYNWLERIKNNDLEKVCKLK